MSDGDKTIEVPSWPADRVRALLRDSAPGAIALVDVRQPDEFAEGHIPGALLIPLGELPERLAELDPQRTTVTYCRTGRRGGAGAAVLATAGFRDVANLDGGLAAWNGQAVTGSPEAGRLWFSGARTLAAVIARAWLFEEGAGIFYRRAASLFAGRDDEAFRLFRDLAAAEEHHKDALLDIFRRIAGPDAPHPLGERTVPDAMEGGAILHEALEWLPGRPVDDVLEFGMALEAVAYDRYVQLGRAERDPEGQELFRLLASAEKHHYDDLGMLFAERR